MRILTKEEYRKMLPVRGQGIMGGKRISEIMAFRDADTKYGELIRYSERPEADRNGYNSAIARLVSQKTILPHTYKIHVAKKSNTVLIENLRIPEE